MLLDADDSLCAGCVRTTLDFMDRHPDVGLFFTNYDIYDENGVVTASGVDGWKRFRRLAHREPRPQEWIFTESLAPHIIEAGGFMHTSGLTFRREVLERTGPFQEGYCYGEDDEFYARVAHVTTAGYVDRVLSRKRNHAGSIIHDESNTLRNTRHLLELSEIQLAHYHAEPAIVEILHRKIRELAISWCYLLVRSGRAAEARRALGGYMSRYPRDPGMYRLWLRSWVPF
jgi:GT2 family glycosyltransferase